MVLLEADVRIEEVIHAPLHPIVTDATGPLHITLVIERSRALREIGQEMLAGLHDFVRDQQAIIRAGDHVTLSIYLFDDTIRGEMVREALRRVEVPIPGLPRTMMSGGANTSLWDAIGFAMNHADTFAEPNTRYIVAVIATGQDTFSKDHAPRRLRPAIDDRHRRGNWSFAFLPLITDDALSHSPALEYLGHPDKDNVASFFTRGGGPSSLFAYLSSAVRAFRERGIVGTDALFAITATPVARS